MGFLFDKRPTILYHAMPAVVCKGCGVRILITGANGQVGQALVAALRDEHQVVAATRPDFDLSSFVIVDRIAAARPDLVIHAAAWTNVDGCARDPDLALLVNGLGTRRVALACQQLDIPLVYISTNEVFDGRSDMPYSEFDRPNPINPYAFSKWAGEQAVTQLLRKFYIVRVAWVFGGERNFVRTILRLAEERPELAVVDDEIGNPTYAPDIADAVRQLIGIPAYGVYHFVNEGHCSRYDFAREILRANGTEHVAVRPIKLAEFRRDSTPPAFGALRNVIGRHDLGISLPSWQDALDRFLRTLKRPPAS